MAQTRQGRAVLLNCPTRTFSNLALWQTCPPFDRGLGWSNSFPIRSAAGVSAGASHVLVRADRKASRRELALGPGSAANSLGRAASAAISRSQRRWLSL